MFEKLQAGEKIHDAPGLWQAKEDIVRSLAKWRSNAAKRNALKAQLNLRKQVLEQKSYLDKDLFLFSKN